MTKKTRNLIIACVAVLVILFLFGGVIRAAILFSTWDLAVFLSRILTFCVKAAVIGGIIIAVACLVLRILNGPSKK